jgi:dTDP-4-dehydrorhamnose reductase
MGDGKVSVIDVKDIAAVAVACLTEPGHEGKKYILTGPEALSNYDVAEKLTTYLGRTITYLDVSPTQAEENMKRAGMSPWMVRVLLELFQICKDGYANQISPAVEQILKRKATSFEKFLVNNLGFLGEPVREVQQLPESRELADYELKPQV